MAEIADASARAAADCWRDIQPELSFLQAMRRVLPRDAIVTDDLCQAAYASWYGFPVYEPRSFISSGYQGNLGSGFPTALGVKAAHPDRVVVAIAGDGGFMFGAQELATAAQYGLGVIVVLFNNNAYGNVLRDQAEQFDGRLTASKLQNPDFPAFARSFGVGASQVQSPEQLASALEAAMADGGPRLIEVQIESQANPWRYIHPKRP